MADEPKLSKWKLAEKKKPEKKQLSVSDPISIPDAPQSEPEPLVLPAPGDAPEGLEPFPATGWFPMGEKQFAWTVRQLGDIAETITGLSGVEGPVAGTEVENIFITQQTIEVLDLTNEAVNLVLTLENTNPAVSYPLRVGHTYQPGVGPVALGVGISLEVESATEGVKESIAAFEAQSTVNTAGAMTGEAGINVVVAGDPERVMTFGHQYIRNHFQPAAVTTRALFELGTGSTFVGPGAGTYIGAKAEAGFTGDYVNFWRAGEADPDFRIDFQGNVYVAGTLLGGGGDAFIGQSNAWSAPQTFVGETTLRITDAATTGPTTVMVVEHRLSAGIPAVGFGQGIDFWGEDEANTRRIFGRIHTEGKDLGVAAIDSDLVFSSSRNGNTTEVLRFTDTGRMNIVDEVWQNAVKRRLHRSAMVVLMSAFTPGATGADTAEIQIPSDPEDGTTSLTWNVRGIYVRVGTAGGAPSLKVQKSNAAGAFGAGTDIGTVTLGSGDNEASKTSAFDSGTVTSSDKVRVSVLALGTATDWSVQLLLEQS